MIKNREQEVALQLVLAASIKHSRMLGDFMHGIVGDRLRRLEQQLSARDWEMFSIDCAHRDPEMNTWAESTRRKLFQVIIRILAEARYLTSTRSMALATPPLVHPDVRRYLVDRGDDYALSCMALRR